VVNKCVKESREQINELASI